MEKVIYGQDIFKVTITEEEDDNTGILHTNFEIYYIDGRIVNHSFERQM